MDSLPVDMHTAAGQPQGCFLTWLHNSLSGRFFFL